MVDPSRPNGYEGCFHAARVRSLAFHLCDPNIDGCMYWDHSIYVCMYEYVYTPVEADVPKLSRVHMGRVRPKINDAAVVY